MATNRDISAASDRRSILNRIKRLTGQIRGVSAMVDDEKACEDVLTQLTAAKSALNKVGLHYIACTVKAGPATTNGSNELVVQEAMRLFLAFTRPLDRGEAEKVSPVSGAAHARIQELLDGIAVLLSSLETPVSQEGDCEGVLATLTQARTSLDQVCLLVVSRAMMTCMAPSQTATRDEIVDEALAAFVRFIGVAR